MRAVVAYCRSACEEPGTPSSAYSQADDIGRFAAQQGLRIDRVYLDPGVSGITLVRPALLQLIADCKTKKIGTVIVRDKERLSRDSGQLLLLLHQFKKCGVRVLGCAPNGKLFSEFDLTVLGAVSEFLERRERDQNNLKP